MNKSEVLRQAKILFASGQLEECVEVFTEAEGSGCEYIEICLSRGAALVALGRYQDAHRDFTRVIEGDKNHERARYYRGIVNAALGRFQEAIEDLTVSLSQNNSRGIAHLVRGLSYAELGFTNDAVLDINSADPFSTAEVKSFQKLFGQDSSLFQNSHELLAKENAPWNNLLTKDAAEQLNKMLH